MSRFTFPWSYSCCRCTYGSAAGYKAQQPIKIGREVRTTRTIEDATIKRYFLIMGGTNICRHTRPTILLTTHCNLDSRRNIQDV